MVVGWNRWSEAAHVLDKGLVVTGSRDYERPGENLLDQTREINNKNPEKGAADASQSRRAPRPVSDPHVPAAVLILDGITKPRQR
jgi:hypothetical protein